MTKILAVMLLRLKKQRIIIIFLPFIKAISKKFGIPVSLLVKENSKANEILNQTNYIDEVIHLERDNKINQKHDGLRGFF